MENNEEKFNEQLDEIRKNAIIEVKKWWGLKITGYA